MSDRELWERLRRRTGQAVAESAHKEATLRRQRPRSPRPGDVYSPGESPDSPVEWVVLATDVDDRSLIAVPADTNPMAGSHDLAVDDPSAGPLVLRLGLAIPVAVGVFEPTDQRGALGADSLELAQSVHREVETGETRGTIRQREIDVDPVYEDWIREYVEPARDALANPSVSRGEDRVLAFPEKHSAVPRGLAMTPTRWNQLLAAALVLVTVGLSSWIASQQRDIARLSRPSSNLPSSQIRLNEIERTAEPIAVGYASHLLLYFYLTEAEPCGSYELEIRGNDDRRVWAESFKDWPVDDVNLVLPRAALEHGPLTLRLHATCGGQRKLLDERRLRFTLK